MEAGLASCSPDTGPCLEELADLSVVGVEEVHGDHVHCSLHLVHLCGGGQTDRQGIAGHPSFSHWYLKAALAIFLTEFLDKLWLPALSQYTRLKSY